jgi:hypothetical protein
MGASMEELLILILQGFAEVLLQMLGSGLLDVLTWGIEGDDNRPSRGCTLGILLFAAGCGLGWLSLWLAPHNLLPWGWLRIANLVIGPMLSAWLSWWIARWRQRRDPEVVPRHHVISAALACLGLVLVRFTWGVR